jgi:hypothetical protein
LVAVGWGFAAPGFAASSIERFDVERLEFVAAWLDWLDGATLAEELASLVA